MEPHIKDNIIRILNKTIDSIKEEDIKKIRDLSNETVHDATVYQDEYSITTAVLIYALSKIYERDFQYAKLKGWQFFCIDCFKGLEIARNKLVNNDIQGFDTALKKYINTLEKLDPKLRLYIKEIFRRSKITKASRLYEHGLSVGRTAELLGITKFEVMDYIGKTYIADVKENTTIKPLERLNFARGLFK